MLITHTHTYMYIIYTYTVNAKAHFLVFRHSEPPWPPEFEMPPIYPT